MSMLKQIVVDIEMAKGLRQLGYREPCLAYFDFEGKLCNMNSEEAIVRDMNGPKETPGRGARCYSAPTLTAVQEWLRRKKKASGEAVSRSAGCSSVRGLSGQWPWGAGFRFQDSGFRFKLRLTFLSLGN